MAKRPSKRSYLLISRAAGQGIHAGGFTFCFKHFILLKPVSILRTCHSASGTYRTKYTALSTPIIVFFQIEKSALIICIKKGLQCFTVIQIYNTFQANQPMFVFYFIFSQSPSLVPLIVKL